MTDVEALRWISEEQEYYLEDSRTSAWERDWPEYLVKYLDSTWPGWEAEDDERRGQWLQDRVRCVALGWLTDEQRRQLNGMTPVQGDWKLWLPVELNRLWSDWATASPDELSGWFVRVLPTLLPATESPRKLSWVTAEQRTQLEKFASQRGDWRVWLPQQLDEWWPEWTDSDSATLTPWLTQAISGLEVSSPAVVDESLRQLTWVTGEQQDQLEKFVAQRGDWRVWLPQQLDAWWPEWTTSDGATLAPWLTQAIPGLGLPPEEPPAEPADAQDESPEAVLDRYREFEQAEDQEFLIAKLMDEVVRPALENGELDELTPEEIAELLEQALAAAAQDAA